MVDYASFKNGAIWYCKLHKKSFPDGSRCPLCPIPAVAVSVSKKDDDNDDDFDC